MTQSGGIRYHQALDLAPYIKCINSNKSKNMLNANWKCDGHFVKKIEQKLERVNLLAQEWWKYYCIYYCKTSHFVNKTKKWKKENESETIYQCFNFCSNILNMLKLIVERNNETREQKKENFFFSLHRFHHFIAGLHWTFTI